MISKEEVLHIAKLARLELTEKEVEKMQKDLSAILDYFDVLKKVTLKSADDPEGTPAEKCGNESLRKDEAVAQSRETVEKLIAAAPDKKDDYIKVKNIF